MLHTMWRVDRDKTALYIRNEIQHKGHKVVKKKRSRELEDGMLKRWRKEQEISLHVKIKNGGKIQCQ